MHEALELWTVYRNPIDYPDKYVARKFLIEPAPVMPVATNNIFVANDLHGIRAMLPPGLYCLPRHPEDDPVIVECWI